MGNSQNVRWCFIIWDAFLAYEIGSVNGLCGGDMILPEWKPHMRMVQGRTVAGYAGKRIKVVYAEKDISPDYV